MAGFTSTSREERLVSQDDMGTAYLAPNWFARKVWNPLTMRLGIAGTETLTVQGRRSGRPQSVPLLPVEHEGARYIVSARGETDWVKNLRAARGRGPLRQASRPGRPPGLPGRRGGLTIRIVLPMSQGEKEESRG